MRLLMLMLVLLGWALPVNAAQTYKVPITIVQGSLTFEPRGTVGPIGPTPASFPISRQVFASFSGGNCQAGSVTFAANLVNGGLELQVNGLAAGQNCVLGGLLRFDVEMVVPELGGTVTTTRLVPEVLEFNFADFRRISSNWNTSEEITSSISTIPSNGSLTQALSWDAPPNVQPVASTYISPNQWIPGDTVRFSVQTWIEIQSSDGHNAQGAVRTRWEYRVTVPEPSASLSLPLGMAWLAGMSLLRGGA